MIKKIPAQTGAKLPVLLGVAGLALCLPSASLALANLSGKAGQTSLSEFFTPASLAPQMASQANERVRGKGFRFTPAASNGESARTVTVAVRMDSESAQAISVRSAIDLVPGQGLQLATSLKQTRYNLGVARDYQSFARPSQSLAKRDTLGGIELPGTVSDIDMPDLASFEPGKPSAPAKPGRFKPRISLEDQAAPGRAKGTLEGAGKQTVDLGGSYRVTRNLDVTAGVRIRQEKDRLAPLTDAVQDNQAVYVGTQFRF